MVIYIGYLFFYPIHLWYFALTPSAATVNIFPDLVLIVNDPRVMLPAHKSRQSCGCYQSSYAICWVDVFMLLLKFSFFL